MNLWFVFAASTAPMSVSTCLHLIHLSVPYVQAWTFPAKTNTPTISTDNNCGTLNGLHPFALDLIYPSLSMPIAHLRHVLAKKMLKICSVSLEVYLILMCGISTETVSFVIIAIIMRMNVSEHAGIKLIKSLALYTWDVSMWKMHFDSAKWAKNKIIENLSIVAQTSLAMLQVPSFFSVSSAIEKWQRSDNCWFMCANSGGKWIAGQFVSHTHAPQVHYSMCDACRHVVCCNYDTR